MSEGTIEYPTNETIADLKAQLKERYLDRYFVYHPPKGDQPQRYLRVREAAKAFAAAILDSYPETAERTLALRHVEDAVMRANQRIAVNE